MLFAGNWSALAAHLRSSPCRGEASRQPRRRFGERFLQLGNIRLSLRRVKLSLDHGEKIHSGVCCARKITAAEPDMAFGNICFASVAGPAPPAAFSGRSCSGVHSFPELDHAASVLDEFHVVVTCYCQMCAGPVMDRAQKRHASTVEV